MRPPGKTREKSRLHFEQTGPGLRLQHQPQSVAASFEPVAKTIAALGDPTGPEINKRKRQICQRINNAGPEFNSGPA